VHVLKVNTHSEFGCNRGKAAQNFCIRIGTLIFEFDALEKSAIDVCVLVCMIDAAPKVGNSSGHRSHYPGGVRTCETQN
jgi:hypothetical protein